MLIALQPEHHYGRLVYLDAWSLLLLDPAHASLKDRTLLKPKSVFTSGRDE